MKTDISKFKKNNKKVLAKIAVADKPEKKEKKKLGRTPKNPDQRLSENISLNFTKKEKERLLSISKEKGGLPLTLLIRNLLKENDWI